MPTPGATPNDTTTTTTSTSTSTSNGSPSKMKVDGGHDSAAEPPRKRMKVDDPQVPHYNSHNIYSRPPAPPSSAPIPSLPKIVPTVSPLDFEDGDDAKNGLNGDAFGGCTVAPLREPSEQWPLCAYCHKGGDLSRCSSCRQSYYCNRDCQVAHWDVHCIVCQPGPPQPAALPQGGAPVAPPTTFTYGAPSAYPQNGGGRGYGQYGANGGHPVTPSHRPRQYKKRNSSRSAGYMSSGGSGGGGVSGSGGTGGDQEQYYCEECDRFFKNGQALGGHRSRVHSAKRWQNMEEGASGGAGSPNMTPRGPGRPKYVIDCNL